jgi:hypothetical protein
MNLALVRDFTPGNGVRCATVVLIAADLNMRGCALQGASYWWFLLQWRILKVHSWCLHSGIYTLYYQFDKQHQCISMAVAWGMACILPCSRMILDGLLCRPFPCLTITFSFFWNRSFWKIEKNSMAYTCLYFWRIMIHIQFDWCEGLDLQIQSRYCNTRWVKLSGTRCLNVSTKHTILLYNRV